MKEQITLLAEGRQTNRSRQLLVDPESIRMNLAVGQNFRGEFTLREGEREPMKGLLYSSHRRVRLFTEQFAASVVTAEYEVDVTGLKPGDRIEGSFYLVTGCGEREIPYVFEMTVPVGKTAYEKIRTIEAFADLARQDFDAALMIFENSSFLTLPFMQQPAFAALYHGLYGRGDRRGALEEFLTGCGAKEQMRLTVDEKKRQVSDPQEDSYDSIRIEKNTWGAVNARVRVDVPFIELETRTISEDCFEGDQYELRYTLHPAMLHGGTNYGRITIMTAYQKFEIGVVVMQNGGVALRRQHREYRAAYQRFFQYYVDVRAKDFKSNLLINSMLTELSRLRDSFDAPDILELFHIEVCLMAGQREKAGLLLADVKSRILDRRREEIDAYCYYYYLRTLYSESEEDKEQLIKILRFYYEGEHPSQTIFFLLLLTDKERQDHPYATMEEMQELYDRGCRSPFLYLAACRMYEAQPLLLNRVGAFELHALSFGVRKGMIGRDLAVRIAELSGEERVFRPSYYRLLTRLAERFENTELVTAICRILIQGERKGPEYFPWYEMGVGLDIRLTRLYEYYLYSLPEEWEGELPQQIYLYFSCTNTLDDRSRAVLYDNVLTRFEPGSSVYDSFLRQIEEFATEQVFAGRMSYRLARIYERMIPAEIVDKKLAAALPRLLYCTQITCDNPNWEQVILSYEEWKKEETAVLKNGKAIVSLYSDRCQILFQDAYGNRYAGGTYSTRKLMDAEDLKQRAYELCPNDNYLLLHRCREALERKADEEEALALYEKVLTLPALRDLFCRELTSRIVAGALRGERTETDRARLLRIDDSYASEEDALHMTESFIEDDFCDRAFAMIEHYGYEKLKPSLLLRLCSRACVEQLFDEDRLLLEACYSCLEQRRSDEVILEYLCRHFNGSSEQMLKILLKARQYHAEMYDLPERLLCQMLFTGWREGLDEVFAAYEDGGAMDETLLRAYLVQKCRDFFVADVAAEPSVFGHVERLCSVGELPFICRIALCRYLALLPERTPGQTALCLDVIRYCCERNMMFDFFQAFAAEADYPASLHGLTVVSYRASPQERIRIRYRILPDMDEMRAEILPHIYEGYFCKCFSVFYGERVEYEIYREGPDGLVKASQGTVLPEENREGQDRFDRLNRILYGMDTMEEAALKKEMRSYGVAEAMIDNYFEKL